MTMLEPLRMSATYNGWANERLYAACAALGDADYRRDLGAFFRSVHGTLNHLLLVDRLWLERLRGLAPAFTSLDTELHGDFTALRAARGRPTRPSSTMSIRSTPPRWRSRCVSPASSPGGRCTCRAGWG